MVIAVGVVALSGHCVSCYWCCGSKLSLCVLLFSKSEETMRWILPVLVHLHLRISHPKIRVKTNRVLFLVHVRHSRPLAQVFVFLF